MADVAEFFKDAQLFGQDSKGVVQLSTRLKNISDLCLGDGAASAIVERREYLLCTRVGGFRFCHVAQRSLQVAQIEQQVHVSRAQRGTSCQILLKFLDAHLAVGCVHYRATEVRLRQVGGRCRRRQREVERSGTPIPKVRRARCHLLEVAGQHPDQQWARAMLRDRLPASVEAVQQIVETRRPGLQARKLCGASLWVDAQFFEQHLGTDLRRRIDVDADAGTQSTLEETSHLVSIDAVGVRQETQGERTAAVQQALETQKGPGMLRAEGPVRRGAIRCRPHRSSV